MARMMRMNGSYPSMPKGTEIASYRSYQEAVQAVEVLGDAEFPLNAVTIVGSDLHMVENVMGKLTPGRVALAGAGQGLTWGVFLGLMTMVFVPDVPAILPIMAVTSGLVAGILITVLSWMMRRNRRSFAAQSQLVASKYAVLVSEQTDHAFKLLQNSAGNLLREPKSRVRQTARPTRENLTGATQFGSRPDEKPKFGVRLTDAERAEKIPHLVNKVREADGSAKLTGTENPPAVPAAEPPVMQVMPGEQSEALQDTSASQANESMSQDQED